jgi:hypothetical protein
MRNKAREVPLTGALRRERTFSQSGMGGLAGLAASEEINIWSNRPAP